MFRCRYEENTNLALFNVITRVEDELDPELFSTFSHNSHEECIASPSIDVTCFDDNITCKMIHDATPTTCLSCDDTITINPEFIQIHIYGEIQQPGKRNYLNQFYQI
jgi:hypothetical protein